MSVSDASPAFAGSIPETYDRLLVPLIFEPYAIDIAARVAMHQPARVVEIAAGTGAVTRQLARALPLATSIIATDLNQPMLDRAIAMGTALPVEWRQADAMQLPFADGFFDIVVCQFGVMFLPDKSRAFAESRRVLRPGGRFIFNVWDRIEQNEFAHTVNAVVAGLFPSDPPQFMARVPHGYHDTALIARDLAGGGFDRSPDITTLTARSRAESPRIPAVAYCEGTPLRNEIEARDATRLADAVNAAETAIASRFGRGPVEGRIRAHVVSVQR